MAQAQALNVQRVSEAPYGCPMLAQWLLWQSQMFSLSCAGQIRLLDLPSVFEETPSVSSLNSPTSIAFLTNAYSLSDLHQLLTSPVSPVLIFLPPSKKGRSLFPAFCLLLCLYISKNSRLLSLCLFLSQSSCVLESQSYMSKWTFPPGRLTEI